MVLSVLVDNAEVTIPLRVLTGKTTYILLRSREASYPSLSTQTANLIWNDLSSQRVLRLF
jgi:hypothetical protein